HIDNTRCLIDIERASLRELNSTSWKRRTVSQSAVCRLLNERDSLREIAVDKVNRAGPEESHPLAIVYRHAAEKISEPVELKRMTIIKRTTDSDIRQGKTRVSEHWIRRCVYSAAVPRIIPKSEG